MVDDIGDNSEMGSHYAFVCHLSTFKFCSVLQFLKCGYNYSHTCDIYLPMSSYIPPSAHAFREQITSVAVVCQALCLTPGNNCQSWAQNLGLHEKNGQMCCTNSSSDAATVWRERKSLSCLRYITKSTPTLKTSRMLTLD